MPSCWTDEATFGGVLETGLADRPKHFLPELEIPESRPMHRGDPV
jgi:hypothetical protein